MPRITKAMLEEEIERLRRTILMLNSDCRRLEAKIESLTEQLKIYRNFAGFMTDGSIAIQRTCDAVAHVLTDLKRGRRS
jgi:chromosome segregation ATPase